MKISEKLRAPFKRRRELKEAQAKSIYPMLMPRFELRLNLEFLLLNMPCLNQILLPLGLGYVEKIFQAAGADFQIFDVNIDFYHRYHATRLFTQEKLPRLPGGEVVGDPWASHEFTRWGDSEFLALFDPWCEELLDELAQNPPRFVGFSINPLSAPMSKRFVARLRERLPQVKIFAGGSSCFYASGARKLLNDFDFVFVGESENSLAEFLRRARAGGALRDLPGVLSRHDSPEHEWQPAEPPTELDKIGFPTYDYVSDLKVYRTFNGVLNAAINPSRGCVWSRCRFCNERLSYRSRPAQKVFEELAMLHRRGAQVVMLSESDSNGTPDILREFAELIIRHQLKLQLWGQLRIHKANTVEYMKTLRRAGLTRITFGVDGWSDSLLRLQNKGYTMKMVEENLRAGREANIRTGVNIVVGVPGETDEMVQEACENLARLAPLIDRVDNLTALMLGVGSVYWLDPAAYKIKFRIPAEEAADGRNIINNANWYSEEPYIDADIRSERLERFRAAMRESGLTASKFGELLTDFRK